MGFIADEFGHEIAGTRLPNDNYTNVYKAQSATAGSPELPDPNTIKLIELPPRCFENKVPP